MRNKSVFKIAFISIIIFIIVATYFWFLYFKNHESKITMAKERLSITNNGNINYINAIVNDKEENIPTYYFRVNNAANEEINYEILLEDVLPQDVGDGCSSSTILTRDQLEYELKLNNKVVSTGLLISLKDNVLNVSKIGAKSQDSYSLRIWLGEKALDSEDKHYHYVVNLKEI